MNKLAATAVALLAGTGLAMAQTAAVPERRPDPLARPAAPATTNVPDGVRNGTTKEERDSHTGAGETRTGENATRPATGYIQR